jgi:hypothetical protein
VYGIKAFLGVVAIHFSHMLHVKGWVLKSVPGPWHGVGLRRQGFWTIILDNQR